MELLMALAKTMSDQEIVNELDLCLKKYRDSPSEKTMGKLNGAAILLTLHNVTNKMSMMEAIKMVEDMKRKQEIFNIKPN